MHPLIETAQSRVRLALSSCNEANKDYNLWRAILMADEIEARGGSAANRSRWPAPTSDKMRGRATADHIRDAAVFPHAHDCVSPTAFLASGRRPLALHPSSRQATRLVVKYGGGRDSTAMICLLHKMGVRPDAIVFADTESEHPATYEYMRDHMSPWLARIGWPGITVVRRRDVVRHRDPSLAVGLLGLCQTKRMLPSAAYGFSKCSMKYKAEPSFAWLRKQSWAKESVDAGARVWVAIGYDATEDHRVRDEFTDARERAWCRPWYPLYERYYDRDGCAQLIEDAGLPIPRKSACFFCPYNRVEEYAALSVEHPELFEACLDLERVAKASGMMESQSVGLARRWRRGASLVDLYQSKEWGSIVAGVVDEDDEDGNPRPCGCGI